MATVGEDAKKIMLRSCDAKEFEVDEAVAKQLEMFAKMIKGGCPEGGIPLLNITNKALDVVLEYCKQHTDFATTEEEIAAWDADYINVGQDILYDVIMASNILSIKLRKSCCYDPGKDPDEIRQRFITRNW